MRTKPKEKPEKLSAKTMKLEKSFRKNWGKNSKKLQN
jgi:hypothetical protein